jgi:hypothetical protein
MSMIQRDEPSMLKSKFSAAVSLLLVFLSGALIGAVGYRLYTVKAVSSTASTAAQKAPPDPEEVRKRLVADMRTRLSLDEKQVVQLVKIYADTRQQFDELHKRANSETRSLWENQTTQIRGILNKEQLAKWEQWRAEPEAERKRNRQRFEQNGPRDGGPGPNGPGGRRGPGPPQ